MRTVTASACILLLAGAFASLGAEAHCSPPCGPIPVVVEIKTNAPKMLTFGEAEALTLDGTVSFYINIDSDGYWFDPQKPPELQFRVNKQPPWVKTNVEPDHFTIPISDPQFVSQEGSPDQLQYSWQAPIKITMTKSRDPTPDEVVKGGPYIRPDGTYRILVSASTTSSVLMPDVFGPNMGLQEGYAVKELRIIPEIGGDPWTLNDEGRMAPQGGALPPPGAKGAAPAPAVAFALVAFVALALVLRRRA
jgi:hypothetical protein